MICGEGENKPKIQEVQEITQEAMTTDFIVLLLQNFPDLEFESRKHSATIFNCLVNVQINGVNVVVNYLLTKLDILQKLLDGYLKPDIALLCGSMLRSCLEYPVLYRNLLWSPDFFKLFSLVNVSNFEVASDAFVTFKDYLSKHKQIASDFLIKNFDNFFKEYTKLLLSNNYVTKRQSLRLLSELLLDRSNFNVMTKYINDPENLKLMMNFLLDKSKNIQYEGFHVFKVFVANPKKPKEITDILFMNKDNLISYLSTFHSEKDETDEQFKEEKKLLITEIKNLNSIV
jgi:calcium binding protein 39